MSADGSIIIDAELSDSKLKSGLGKLGSVAGTALKGIGVAAAAAATAVVAIGTAAVKSYAEYEQLVGGMQKIFDEVDYSQIAADAQDAYRTMNISANQYMQSMSGVGATFAQTMGDQKGYETAKQGMQAIADYASGTGKSVDELMTKYQAITRNASGYLSIADQFSGLLPQTTDGFLEQAQAAGYVSEEYRNLSEVPVAEYQSALTQLLEDGVNAMGLLGNTVAETEDTISGSLNAMKASWSNLLVGLADDTQDFDKLLQNFISSVGTFAKNLVPRIGVALGGIADLIAALGPQIAAVLPELVTGLLPQLAESAIAIVQALVQGIADNAATIAESAVQILTTLITGIIEMAPMLLEGALVLISELAMALGEQLPTLIPMAVEMILTLVMGLIENIDLLVQGAIALMNGLAQGLIAALPTLIAQAPVIIQNLVNALVDNLPLLLSAALQIIVMLVQGIITNLPQLLTAAGQIIGSIVSGIIQFIGKIVTVAGDIVKNIWDTLKNTNWLQLGSDIITGIVNGLKAAAGAVIDFMKNLAASALDAIKEFFGIASPSKLMAKEVGRWIPPGIVVGMDKAMPAALRDIKATASEITGQIQAALLGGQNGMRLSYATAAGGSEAVAAGNVYHYSQVVNTHDSLSPRELTEEHEAMKAREGWQLA